MRVCLRSVCVAALFFCTACAGERHHSDAQKYYGGYEAGSYYEYNGHAGFPPQYFSDIYANESSRMFDYLGDIEIKEPVNPDVGI